MVNNRSHFESGFSLFEIMVVVVVIGILAAAGIGSYAEVRERARDSQRAASLQQLQIAIESYKDVYGEYPDRCASGSNWSGDVKTGQAKCNNPGDDFIIGLVPDFVPALPRDPLYDSQPEGYGYLYTVDATNQSYKLLAYMTVETETVTWGHPLARCPVLCDRSSAAPSSYCDTGSVDFTDFASTYGVYSSGTLMCD